MTHMLLCGFVFERFYVQFKFYPPNKTDSFVLLGRGFLMTSMLLCGFVCESFILQLKFSPATMPDSFVLVKARRPTAAWLWKTCARSK